MKLETAKVIRSLNPASSLENPMVKKPQRQYSSESESSMQSGRNLKSSLSDQEAISSRTSMDSMTNDNIKIRDSIKSDLFTESVDLKQATRAFVIPERKNHPDNNSETSSIGRGYARSSIETYRSETDRTNSSRWSINETEEDEYEDIPGGQEIKKYEVTITELDKEAINKANLKPSSGSIEYVGLEEWEYNYLLLSAWADKLIKQEKNKPAPRKDQSKQPKPKTENKNSDYQSPPAPPEEKPTQHTETANVKPKNKSWKQGLKNLSKKLGLGKIIPNTKSQEEEQPAHIKYLDHEMKITYNIDKEKIDKLLKPNQSSSETPQPETGTPTPRPHEPSSESLNKYTSITDEQVPMLLPKPPETNPTLFSINEESLNKLFNDSSFPKTDWELPDSLKRYLQPETKSLNSQSQEASPETDTTLNPSSLEEASYKSETESITSQPQTAINIERDPNKPTLTPAEIKRQSEFNAKLTYRLGQITIEKTTTTISNNKKKLKLIP